MSSKSTHQSCLTNYISSAHDWNTDKIVIWERPIAGGERTAVLYDAPRYFYVPDENGEHNTIDGVKVKKLVFDTKDEFTAATNKHRVKYESDIQPEARVLMDKYYGRATPVVNYVFLDIEVDYSSKIGWSSPENPYAPINAITIFKSWTGEYLTYAVPPKGWAGNEESLQEELKELWSKHKLSSEPNVTICKTERDLLLYMLDDIQDADIISGWNSEFFDNPYIIKRLERVLGKKGPMHMSFKGAPAPRERIVNRFGSPAITYTLYGRTHLDYLDLFKKFTFEGRTSYSLANITAEELDVPKLDYPGTLEQLYHNDFGHFIAYNRHDVGVLVQLDKKFKLMQLVNQMAHENTVPFQAILGTVRYVETGMINRARNVHNLIVCDKNITGELNAKVEGAIVMTPRAGLWDWVGSVDITSLYPSTARALNMSIETFVGQFVLEERAWEGVRAKDNNEWEAIIDNQSITTTGEEWHKFLREHNYAISGFGTIFDQNKPGIVADTLTYWFNERLRLQVEKKRYSALAKAEQDPKKKTEYQMQAEHFDLLQLTKKIQLNSAYGALLNEAFRFGRREIGASITGSGRQITKHMGQTIGELITGNPCVFEKRYGDFKNKATRAGSFESGELYGEWVQANNFEALRKLPQEQQWTRKYSKEDNAEIDVGSGAIWFTECPAIIYGDTDSSYFKTGGANYEEAVELADEIAKQTNATFPAFMKEAFNCTDGREKLINAAREIVAERAVFMHIKKKYTLRVVNIDGTDLRAQPKLKSMGSEIKKADTPKVVQDFLKSFMDLVLTGQPYETIEKFINSHRGTLINEADVLKLAPAKQVNNLDALYAEYKRTEKINAGKMKHCPGHVRAAINFNEMIEYFNDKSQPMKAGDKAAILYLKNNQFGIDSIGFPTDMQHLPEWFKENFSVDLRKTEEKMIDNKISGIFKALNLEVPSLQLSHIKQSFSF